jgi:hypothetical protein
MTTADATTRQVVLDGSFNFRDLGGYPTASGAFVAWRRLYRADGPHALSAADIARLPNSGSGRWWISGRSTKPNSAAAGSTTSGR